jgi:hypothetical protein
LLSGPDRPGPARQLADFGLYRIFAKGCVRLADGQQVESKMISHPNIPPHLAAPF